MTTLEESARLDGTPLIWDVSLVQQRPVEGCNRDMVSQQYGTGPCEPQKGAGIESLVNSMRAPVALATSM